MLTETSAHWNRVCILHGYHEKTCFLYACVLVNTISCKVRITCINCIPPSLSRVLHLNILFSSGCLYWLSQSLLNICRSKSEFFSLIHTPPLPCSLSQAISQSTVWYLLAHVIARHCARYQWHSDDTTSACLLSWCNTQSRREGNFPI